MADVLARGLRFHVQRIGAPSAGDARPVVVVLHGLVMDNLSSFYFTLANPMASVGEALLYDLRGHGKSERPATGYTLDEMVSDLEAVLTATVAQTPVFLVGNSFGGLLGLAFAARYPERARGLVLIDGHLGESGWTDRMAATLELEGEARDQQIMISFQSWLGRHSERKSTRLADAASKLVYGTSLVRDMKQSGALADEELSRVTCPVLAIYGETSDLRAQAERVAARIPTAELVVLPGCSHSVLWEATARVRDDVIAWVARHAASGAKEA
jgi:pimeloyl-ACP methyl ester carboxylesterase